MAGCLKHTNFFDDSCEDCKQEYKEMKGAGEQVVAEKKYKEFTEDRAKKLYEEILLQYLKTGLDEEQAAKKARSILRKQCAIRGIEPWPWV
ncbi:MAG: hypothetical protein DA330_04045 [Nitrososphaera sp.]|nr:hypothetical protein [Nitrososphaera sp.]